MTCPRCGAENPVGAQYCNLCLCVLEDGGSPSSEQVEEPQSAPQPLDDIEEGAFSSAPPSAAPQEVSSFAGGVLPGPSPSSPSEWGSGQYTGPPGLMPPPPTSAGNSKVRSSATIALAVVVGALCALGAFYGVDRFINGRRSTYDSTVSALTFEYPSSWDKLDGSDFAHLGQIAGIERFNEVFLADSTGSSMKYLVGAGSVKNAMIDWETGKSNVVNLFNGGFQGTLPTMGAAISNSTVTEGTIDGAESLDITFNIAIGGESSDCRITIFHKESTMYMMLFMTMGADSNGQVQEIMKSVDLRD